MQNQQSTKQRYTVMRQEIVQAATQIMQCGGIDKLSMRAVAKMVNTSPANLYEYFLNKEEIIFAVYSEMLSLLYQHLSMLEHTQHSRDDLFELSRQYIAFTAEDPHRIQIISQALQTEGLFVHRSSSLAVITASDPGIDSHEWQGRSHEQNLQSDSAIAHLYHRNTQEIHNLFLQGVQRCLRERTISLPTHVTTDELAHLLWSLSHGLVTLSLQDVSSVGYATIHTAFDALLDGFTQF